MGLDEWRKRLQKKNAGVKEENFVDVGAARKQAEALFQAGEAMIGTDEDTFVEILSKAGQRQAYYIFEEYKKISGKSIDQVSSPLWVFS